MSTSYALWPLRMSHEPAAAIALFRDLGLRQTVGHDDGTYAVFAGRSGSLGVHAADRADAGPSPASTGLNLITADVEAAAAELRARGLQVEVWDETFGKQGLVHGPGALQIGLNEATQDDLYGGYTAPQEATQTIASSMDVVLTCATPDPDAAATFFGEFGFRTDGRDPAELTASRTSGILALQRADGAVPRFSIGFRSSEPLDALAARLGAAGHRSEVIEDGTGVRVQITDPDGDLIVVRLTS